jgi:Tfp pilus assembly protein PilV
MTAKKRKKIFPVERRAGFSLIEVIVAGIILAIAITASFSVIAFALVVTIDTRGRMGTYALAERAGFLSIAEKEAAVPSLNHSVITRSVNLSPSPSVNKEGASDSHEFKMRMVTHKCDPIAISLRITKFPVAVVFLAQP